MEVKRVFVFTVGRNILQWKKQMDLESAKSNVTTIIIPPLLTAAAALVKWNLDTRALVGLEILGIFVINVGMAR